VDWLLGVQNAYDVMGLAPDASNEDIEAEFDMLVNRKGYRVGLPRSSWRQRLSEIKSAHATLSDPVKRRAHDRSLGLVSDPPLWQSGLRSDEFSDALVRPARASRKTSKAAASGLLGSTATLADRAGSPTSVWPEETQDVEPEAERSDDDMNADPWPAARPDHKKTWAIGAALTLGLNAILFASWQQPSSPRQTASDKPQSLAAASAAKFAAPSLGLPPTVSEHGEAASGLTPEEQAAAAGDERAASASLSDWVGKEDASGGEIALAAPANVAAKPDAEPVPPLPVTQAPIAAAGQVPASTAPTDAPVQNAVQATQPVTVTPPPPVAVPQVSSRISVALPPEVAAVTPPKLIRGAPSDADNRRGQYRGSLVVQFTIGSEGRAKDCAIARTSGDAKLDALTCRILETRTRFTPAKNEQGVAVPSVANATYVWGRGRRAKK
jgi:protein TonB